MKETTSFVFYPEWAEALSGCSREVRSLVYEAVIEYGTTGIEPAIESEAAAVAFAFIRIQIDRNRERYEAVCEKRRKAAEKRWSSKPSKPQKPSRPAGTSAPSAPSSPSVSPETAVYQDVSGDEFLEEFFADNRREAVEQLCRVRDLGDVDNFRRLARDVVDEWRAMGRLHHPDRSDAYSHLVNQCSIKKQKEKTQTATNAAATATAYLTPNQQYEARQREFAESIRKRLARGEDTFDYNRYY